MEMEQDEFPVFVSYYELTGKRYAEVIRKALKEQGINAFVAHVEREKYSGNFEEHINDVISKCKFFVLVLTLDSLQRPQVIREVKQAFPSGLVQGCDLWVFRQDLEAIGRSDSSFETETQIKLDKLYQQDFHDDSDLATKVIIQYRHRKSLQMISKSANKPQDTFTRIYDIFASYAKKIVYDYEHYSEFKDSGKKPIIETMMRSNLYEYFIPLNVAFEVKAIDPDTGKNRFVIRQKEIGKYISDWTKSTSPLCVLLGDYGSGKTSSCLYLTYSLAKTFSSNPRSPIPIFVSLRDYAGSKDIHNFLSDLLIRQYNIKFDVSAFVQLLEEGEFILILDGFDEMATKSDKESMLNNLRQIMKLITNKSKLILTSRTHYFRSEAEIENVLSETVGINELEDIAMAEIKPLDPDQILLFLKKRTYQWEDQFSKINTIYNLADLATRPLLLDMISQTISRLLYNNEEIDASLLYKTYTDLWIQHDDWRSVMTPDGKSSFMKGLATGMYNLKKTSIHFTKLLPPLKTHFKKIHEFSNKADNYYYDATTCSFLNRDKDGNYTFIHKSFMEYFVAESYWSEIKQNNLINFGTGVISKEIRDFLVMIMKRELKKDPLYYNRDENDVIEEILNSIIIGTRDHQKPYYRGGTALTMMRTLNIDLKGKDLSSCILINGEASKTSFQTSNLSRCAMQFMKLNECNLYRTDLSGSVLNRSEFNNSNLQYVTGMNAEFKETKMSSSDCSFANFSGSIFNKSDLSGSKCYKTSFKECKMKEVDFTSASLEQTDMEKADLRKGQFEAANLISARLLGADLRNANMRSTQLLAVDLRGADLRGIEMENVSVNSFTYTRGVKIDYDTYCNIPQDFKRILIRDNPEIFRRYTKDKKKSIIS